MRGVTRDVDGRKLFLDHEINSIRDFIHPDILKRYLAEDRNLREANLFHTRMMVREIDLQNYLFQTRAEELPRERQETMVQKLREEMREIYEEGNSREGEE